VCLVGAGITKGVFCVQFKLILRNNKREGSSNFSKFPRGIVIKDQKQVVHEL
jgi:hypothetical protein